MPNACISANASADNVPLADAGSGDTYAAPSGEGGSATGESLCWKVHLLRSQPARLPGIIAVGGVGAVCVWLMFGAWLPAVAALLLLAGSVSEYLLPITYRLTPQGITQESLTSRLVLSWKDARRCRLGKRGILILSLAAPSRLDAFRGVLLRFAPDHQPGDRSSVLALLAVYAPRLSGTTQASARTDITMAGETEA